MPPRQPTIIQTTTGEMYLPTRLVYTVRQPDALRRWLDKHPAITWDTARRGWTWNYHRKVRRYGFPEVYEDSFRNHGGIVLATCYLPDRRTLHVYTRCGMRTTRFLSFFDKEVSRAIAVGEFIDQYNLITTVLDIAGIRTPEEYFHNESEIEFFDPAALMDDAKTPAEQQAVAALIAERSVTATITPLQRNRLELFYEDGAKAFQDVMEFRDTMALLQHQSDTPIRPYDVIQSALESPIPPPPTDPTHRSHPSR